MFQAAPGAPLAEPWNPVLVASDFPSSVPEDAELTAEQWAEYVQFNVGRQCPAPGPGDEDSVKACGWSSWRSYQALKRVVNW